MNKLWLALLGLLLAAPAQAQTKFTLPPPAGTVLLGVQVVASCGNAGFVSTGVAYVAMDETGALCTNSSGGGSSYTVNYGAANSTKGTPTGFNDSSGNFQPLLGDTTYGQWVYVKATAAPSSLPLPTGAATSALQTTGNTSLGSLVTNLGTLSYDGSGYLEVNVKAGGGSGSNAAASATGSSVPADAGYTGLNNGGNLIGWIGDSSGRGIVAGAGTAGSAAGGVLTVQGVSSMTPILATVSQATASNLNAAVVGTGSAGSAAGGVLTVQGVASMTPVLANPGTSASWGFGTAGSPSSTVQSVQGVSGGTTIPVTVDNTPTVTASVPTVTATALVKGTTSAMTGTSSTQVIAAVSSQHIYVTSMHCTNSSATATLVSIQDGSGGTTLDTLICPAGGGETRSGGGLPLTWTTAGNGLYAADVTTSASVIVSASGYSSAN